MHLKASRQGSSSKPSTDGIIREVWKAIISQLESCCDCCCCIVQLHRPQKLHVYLCNGAPKQCCCLDALATHSKEALLLCNCMCMHHEAVCAIPLTELLSSRLNLTL